jgi:hypothetical protein
LPNYFWQSLVCFFLFLPAAVIALVYSFQVTRRTQAGDRTGAVRASRLARMWCLVALAVFTVAALYSVSTGTVV